MITSLLRHFRNISVIRVTLPMRFPVHAYLERKETRTYIAELLAYTYTILYRSCIEEVV